MLRCHKPEWLPPVTVILPPCQLPAGHVDHSTSCRDAQQYLFFIMQQLPTYARTAMISNIHRLYS